MNPSDRPAGGGEPSSQAFRASRMLVGMPRFVFEFRYSGGKTPLIIVTMMFGMFAIASLTWLHRRWISSGGAETDFEAQRAYINPLL